MSRQKYREIAHSKQFSLGPQTERQDQRKSVVVTGASSGIGKACVDRFTRSGFHVWATVRTEEDAAALHSRHPGKVDVLRMDLADEESVIAAGEVVRTAGSLHGLVNNAGIAIPGPLEFMPTGEFRRQIEVNLIGQFTVTKAMLPAMRLAREQGERARVVNIGSIGGRIATAMLGPYHASKFGLVGLTDSLRLELAPWGIEVVLIEPGSVDTPIWRKGITAGDELYDTLSEAASCYAGRVETVRTNAEQTAARATPVERIAETIVKAVTSRNPRPRQAAGRDAKLAGILARLLPYSVLYQLLARTDAVL